MITTKEVLLMFCFWMGLGWFTTPSNTPPQLPKKIEQLEQDIQLERNKLHHSKVYLSSLTLT